MSRILRLVEPTYNYNLVNKSSILLTSRQQINDSVNEYHTSLGDMDAGVILDAVSQFDVVELVADHYDQSSALFVETLILLNYLSHRMPVVGMAKQNPVDFLSDIDLSRNNNHSMLWVFGCSHTFGVGLEHSHQRYADLVAAQLNMPVKVVAKPGSSVDWSFRHLVNCEISNKDTVVWQITTLPRFTKKTTFDNSFTEVSLKQAHKADVLFWTDEQLFYKHLSTVNAGIKHLRSIGCKISMISLNEFSDLDYRCIMEYSKYPEYCFMPDSICDYGNDHIHFGPATHQNIATGLVKHMESSYV